MPSVSVFILAGGAGTRFWPLSRSQRPKQFLPLAGGSESLLAATARRIRSLAGGPRISIVTNQVLAAESQRHVPDANIIAEPLGRNTAASIGLAAVVAATTDPETVMVVLPADHAVRSEPVLRATLERAIAIAQEKEVLVTIGIRPLFAHTGYGYVQRGAEIAGHPKAYDVKRFFEKPNQERAQSYVDSGEFLWNSGMFVFRASVLLRAVTRCLPAMSEGLLKIQKAWGTNRQSEVLSEVFPLLESISIDVGVLEHVENRVVVEAEDFGWNDVGSWDAWAEQFPKDEYGNLCSGEVVVVDSSDCVVRLSESSATGKGKPIALLGVQGLVIIDAGDALLVCSRDRTQDVKKVVEALRERGRSDLL